jgi:hypothetical protein
MEIMEAWQALVRACDAKVAECMADPEGAVLDGIQPEYDGVSPFIVYGGRGEPPPKSEQAAWMRGVARKLIDSRLWNYRVYEAMGGKTYLALLSFNGEDDHVFDDGQ